MIQMFLKFSFFYTNLNFVYLCLPLSTFVYLCWNDASMHSFVAVYFWVHFCLQYLQHPNRYRELIPNFGFKSVPFAAWLVLSICWWLSNISLHYLKFLFFVWHKFSQFDSRMKGLDSRCYILWSCWFFISNIDSMVPYRFKKHSQNKFLIQTMTERTSWDWAESTI